MQRLRQAGAYANGHDRVRSALEEPFFGSLVPSLLRSARGGALLDLGCADGLAARLAGPRLERYVGVDLAPPPSGFPGTYVPHDLRRGLGSVGDVPFDVYLATFGVASHLDPVALERILVEIARHARPGAIVALEALGLYSLEWPRLWDTRPGARRTIPYRLGADVCVHPWAPRELARLYSLAGIRPLRVLDRTLQAGPKVGEGRYWPGLPKLRRALDRLLAGDREARSELERPLPPLPAGAIAASHHRLAALRRRLVAAHAGPPARLARAVWSLEPRRGGGLGHGLVLIGRVV